MMMKKKMIKANKLGMVLLFTSKTSFCTERLGLNKQETLLRKVVLYNFSEVMGGSKVKTR